MYQISLIHQVEVDIWTKVIQTLHEQCPSDASLMSLENKPNYVRSSESQKASLIYSHIALLIFIIYYYFVISWETMFFLDHWEYWECRGSKMFLYAEGVQWGVDIGTLSGHACEHNLWTCHDITLSDYPSHNSGMQHRLPPSSESLYLLYFSKAQRE